MNSSNGRNFKYFFGYIADSNIKPFSIILLKIRAYIKSYDGRTKWMYFLMKGEKLLKKINNVWSKVSYIINKATIKKIFANPKKSIWWWGYKFSWQTSS